MYYVEHNVIYVSGYLYGTFNAIRSN